MVMALAMKVLLLLVLLDHRVLLYCVAKCECCHQLEVVSDIMNMLEQEEQKGEDSEKNKIVKILKSIIEKANSSPSLGSS